MELLFGKLNTDSNRELEEFNELMGVLDSKAVNLNRLKEIIVVYNQREDAYLMVVKEKDSNRIIGTLLAVLVQDYCGDCHQICYVENVVVHPDFQRCGVGKAMFEELFQYCESHDVYYEDLVSSNLRTGAHQFYKSIGYVQVKGFKRYHR